MKNILIALTTFLTLGFCNSGIAQNNTTDLALGSDYNFAVGLRAGETSGLTLKKMNGDRALKGIVGLWNHGFTATVLVEKYTQAFGVSGLNWFYGGGGHVAVASYDRGYFYRGRYRRYERYDNGTVGLGVDGIAGIEYKIPNAPFALSLDLKPYVEVTTAGYFWSSIDPGFGIKVTF